LFQDCTLLPRPRSLPITRSSYLCSWDLLYLTNYLWLRNSDHVHGNIKVVHSRRNLFIMILNKNINSMWVYSTFMYKSAGPKLRFLLWNRILRITIGLLRKANVQYVNLTVHGRNIKHLNLLRHTYFIMSDSKRSGVKLRKFSIIYKQSFGFIRLKKIARRKRRLQRRATTN
jgi:hypothetical protein